MGLRLVESESRVPPHDVDAERALLAIAIAGDATGRVLEHVPIVDFYFPTHRQILTTMRAVELDGLIPDPVTVLGRLKDKHPSTEWGRIVGELSNAPGHVSHVPQHAAIVRDKARLRRIIEQAQRIAAEGYIADDADAFSTGAIAALEAASTIRKRTALVAATTEEIFSPLEPVPWVCRDLCIGPGRPTLVVGYGFAGKTLAMQAFALAVAGAQRVWGQFFARQGRVLHLDYEQGRHATNRRYQRLLYASGQSTADLEGNLAVVYFPTVYLTDANAEEELCTACEGVSVCIIDSFRAAAPSADENASDVRVYLDKLTRVSERTGCSFVVIHHAGKTSPDRSKKESARGSSAIFDACGTVLLLSSKEPYAPVKVEIAKVSASATGKHADGFHLEIQDVPDDDAADMQAGLRLAYRTDEQVDPPKSQEQSRSEVEADVLAILEGDRARAALQGHPWSGMAGNDVRAMCRARKEFVGLALRTLEDAGKVRSAPRRGKGGGLLWVLVDSEGGDP